IGKASKSARKPIALSLSPTVNEATIPCLPIPVSTSYPHCLTRRGRIVATREPVATSGPAFTLMRSQNRCTWAIHEDVPEVIADELDRLARMEPPPLKPWDPPVHAECYVALVGGEVSSGPAF